MKKEIKIKIKGIHESPEGEIEPVEVIALGQMFDKDGFLCITYEEAIDEGDDGVVSRVSGNLLKIRDDQVEIIREGPAQKPYGLCTGRNYDYLLLHNVRRDGDGNTHREHQ